jgi:broad specificity phosphatase PhoE
MKPQRIIIIRHGYSDANQDKMVLNHTPDYAIQLTQTGHDQAFEAGQKIKEIVGNETIHAYCSPFWRTRQTYLNLKKSLNIVAFQEDPRIREQEFGTRLNEMNHKFDQDKERNEYGHFYFRLDGGESGADCYDRVSDFIGTLYRDFEKPHYPNNALIVTHGLTSRILLMRWLKLSVEEFEILKNPKNCEFFVLERDETGKYALITELPKHENYTHPYQFNWTEPPV